jgi:RNA polymerase sigma-70 factor (ECF subfamily)
MASFADVQLDAGVARGLRRGDEQAQIVAYRVLSPSVMGMAVRILQDEGLAQEVLQDTFVELLEHAHTLKEPAAVVGWVRRVAVNHCLMRLRSPWQKRRVSADDETMEETSDPLEGAARSDDLWDLERALSQLPEETRMVLWLHDVEGYTHQEIGALVGKTASFSKSQLARGYQRLADEYRSADARAPSTTSREPETAKRMAIDNESGRNLRPVGSS